MTTDDTDTEDPQFDSAAIESRYAATCRDFIEKNGYQAMVEEHDSDGVTTETWQGMICHSKESEARQAAQAWIRAKVSQLTEVDELRRRRRRAIGPKLAKSMSDMDVLEEQRKKIAAAIKQKKDDHRVWVREAQSPSVEIEFSERGGSFTLVVAEGGRSYDSRQQSIPGTDDGDGEQANEGESHGMDPSAVDWDGDGEDDS